MKIDFLTSLSFPFHLPGYTITREGNSFKNRMMAEFKFETNNWFDDAQFTIQGSVRMREEEGLFPPAAVVPTGNYPFSSSPYNIIQADQDLYFDFRWRCQGTIPDIFHPTMNWHLTVLFERVGGAGPNPAPLILNTGNMVLGSGVMTGTITAPAPYFGVPVGPHETGGNIFRVVATMVMHNVGDVVTPIAGFADLGLVQVYED